MATTPNVKSVQSTFDQRKFLLGAVSALAVGIVAGFGAKLLAGGSAGAYNSSAVNTGDTAWVLTTAALVMLMTPAVGFFYGGMVRSKNVVSVIKQSVVILALVSIQWVLLGYSLAFGKEIAGGLPGGFVFLGVKVVASAPNPDSAPTSLHLAYWIFLPM